MANKERTRVEREIGRDQNAEFLSIKRDLSGAVTFSSLGVTASVTGTGSATTTVGQSLVALKAVVTGTAGTSATGTLLLNGASVGTFSGATGTDTFSTLLDTVATPINTITLTVTATAGTPTVNLTAASDADRWI